MEADGLNNLTKIIQADLVSLCLAAQTLHFLHIEDKALHHQKDCNSLDCGALGLNPHISEECW